MTKAIALLALTAISIGLTFGNYWFTFGLWPKSWLSFVLFAVASLLVLGLIQVVHQSKD